MLASVDLPDDFTAPEPASSAELVRTVLDDIDLVPVRVEVAPTAQQATSVASTAASSTSSRAAR
jgi:hypothetical protein